MKTILNNGRGVSPRTIAKEYGFEVVESVGSADHLDTCYQHPESKIGLLISSTRNSAIGGYSYDWSIHEPETDEVVRAGWSEVDGTFFLKSLIHVLADLTDSNTLPEDSVEDTSTKGECKSCHQLKELDPNGYCWLC